MKPKVSIIIVHYQNQKILLNCLNSIKKTLKLSHEIIVVDNDETKTLSQASFKQFPKVKYLKSKGNLGFGAGCNLGAKQATANYLFFLNPDTILLEDPIKPLLNFLTKSKKTAAVAPLLLDSTQKPYPIQGTSTLTPLKAIFSLSFINKLIPNNSISKSYWINIKTQKTPIKAEVLPGSAFLIRKSIFTKFKGFDSKFFLYFEESDLFKRITDQGYQLFILPQSRLIHYWAKSTPKSKTIKKIFTRSRFYYLKKHFGLLKALLVESFLQLTPEKIGISLIILSATWLRFFKLPEFMTFIGDQGRDYLASRDMVLTGTWPMVGIPSSVPWLFQGSLFIWMTAFALKIGSFHPVTPAILTSTLGVLTVYLTYKLSKTYLSLKPALITALITATSPLLVIHSRMPYHISPIPLFSTLYLMTILRNSVFWTFFLSGILLQFELTTLPLAILALYYFYKQKVKLLPNSLVFFLPFLPKIIHDLTHGFKQTGGFIAWLGFRLISFINPSSHHSVSLSSINTVLKTSFNYWQKFVIYDQPLIAALTGLLVILAFIKTKTKFSKLLLNFILINLTAFLIHGAPSEAYFPVLLPVFALSIGLALDRFKQPLLYPCLVVLSFYNSYHLVINHFIPYGPTLSQRLSVVKMIKSKNIPVKLKNPSNIEFQSFLDNYRYLLWWQQLPEDSKSNLIITIHE